MKSQKFDVMGMTCSACSAHVEKSVKKVPGVEGVNVNLLSNSMSVQFDEAVTDSQAIIRAVKDGGYDARVYQKEGKKQQVPAQSTALQELAHMKKRLIVSLIFLIPLFYLSMGHMLGEMCIRDRPWPTPRRSQSKTAQPSKRSTTPPSAC